MEKRTIYLWMVLLLTTPLWAQNPAESNPQAACGQGQAMFKVKLDDKAHDLLPPEAGKARIYFIHESGSDWSLGYPTTQIGMDGAWLGANHGDSYFSVSAAPGEHHFCSRLQSSLVAQRVELAHLTVEPGKVYYFRTRLTMSRTVELMELTQIDEDQGRYLVSSFPRSVSSLKK